jgi:DNA-binding GntR family transcriptional regulator
MSYAAYRSYACILTQTLIRKLSPGNQIQEEILADLFDISRTLVRDAIK